MNIVAPAEDSIPKDADEEIEEYEDEIEDEFEDEFDYEDIEPNFDDFDN